MNPEHQRREGAAKAQFQQDLEESGALEFLFRALLHLYELEEKPADAADALATAVGRECDVFLREEVSRLRDRTRRLEAHLAAARQQLLASDGSSSDAEVDDYLSTTASAPITANVG